MAYIPSIVVLGLAAFLAWNLARGHDFAQSDVRIRERAARWLAICTLVQSVHFAEELQTRFPDALADLFGVPAMPGWFFLSFNVIWIVSWAWSVGGVRRGNRPAVFAAWFLAIAGVANGILHPVLAATTGAYFPGLITAPFVGIVCWILSRRLLAMRTA